MMSDFKIHRSHRRSRSSPFLSCDAEVTSSSSRSLDLSFVDVNHLQLLSSQLGNLLKGTDNTDVTFIVEEESFEAHRIILSARCEYFRALLYGGMKEATDCGKIPLHETPVNAFKYLLKYIYTGMMSLREIEERDLLDILVLANRYSLLSLESAITGYLKDIVSEWNVTEIYDVARVLGIGDLVLACHHFIDHHAMEVLQSEGFTRFSKNSMQEIISRPSFYAPETEIFNALRRWMNDNGCEPRDLLSCVRLSLIDITWLLSEVRDSKLYSPDEILDAVKIRYETSINRLPHRGFLCEDENVAQSCHHAKVLTGEMKETLLDAGNPSYDLEKGYTRHSLAGGNEGIVIELGKPSIINTIKLLLWDLDNRSYSYKIEFSIDGEEWANILDYSKYFCRSLQTIHFDAVVVKFVKIRGMHNSLNKCFHLVSFECMFSSATLPVQDGVIVPTDNVASSMTKAIVLEGVSRNRNALIDGDTKNYDWESGYTCHQIGSGSITIQLAQPCFIGSMRMLLWDCDDRSYNYYIQVSLDQNKWVTVCDKRKDPCRSWQTIVFTPRPVSFIKIVGTKNTSNEVFHVVHFECPAIEDTGSSLTESVTDREIED